MSITKGKRLYMTEEDLLIKVAQNISETIYK